MAETSTKPYMIRALYEWCCDNGYTPYLAVAVDAHTIVPRQHVKGGEIVLNVSPMATSRLTIGNDMVEFQARFSGVAQQLSIPIDNISAIYARETGHGMAFDVSKAVAAGETDEDGGRDGDTGDSDAGDADADAADADDADAAAPRVAQPSLAPSTAENGAGGAVDDEGSVGSGVARMVDLARRPSQPPGGDAQPAAGGTPEEPPANPRRRSAKGQASADVIAFASVGSAGRKKGPTSRTRAEPDDEDKSADGVGARQGDDEPPPADGGGKGGRSGKARLTRVK